MDGVIVTVLHLSLILYLSSSHVSSYHLLSLSSHTRATLLANGIHTCKRRALPTMTMITGNDDYGATLGKVMARSSAVGS
ncbi:hypothetical protein OsI_37699 [Oryza sativa Indica Group]|uniref:Secreted protein n=1 Tax=Oryza sativa subsp. indica TaxID=39946 RepID=B8BNH3_ORYSI|nr:hypothetical protein OsI_37699 [Oryza sativa Indica Group]